MSFGSTRSTAVAFSRPDSLPWVGPALILVARPALAYVSQALAAAALWLGGSRDPWSESRGWFQVSTTVMDLGCLALLFALTRVEGTQLRDLIGFDRSRAKTDILLGFTLAPVALAVALLGSAVAAALFRGGQPAPSLGSPLPLWAGVYATALWPIGVGFVEEMTYLGYALPRIRRLIPTMPALLIVAGVWSLQHVAEPFSPDLGEILWRGTQFLPLALFFGAVYLKRPRLLTLIVAHVCIDILGGLSQTLLPALGAL